MQIGVWLALAYTAGSQRRCYLHVGPHKCGSTTLQRYLYNFRAELETDGITQFPFATGPVPPWKGGALVATALQTAEVRGAHATFSVWARSQGHIVLSSEEFDKPSVNITALRNMLRGFITVVLVCYRPYYDYLGSLHFELAKWGEPLALSDWIASVPEWPMTMFTYAVSRRYRAIFHDVQVFTLGPDYPKTIVCDVMHATRTCAALSNVSHRVFNARRRTSLLRCAAQCPNSTVLQTLVDTSVAVAHRVKALFPALRIHSEAQLRREFDRRLASLAFCNCKKN